MNHRFVMATIFSAVLASTQLIAASPNAADSGSASLERTGKRLFLQRCSLCHLPPLGRPSYVRSFGPPLNGFVNSPEREARVAEVIRRGTGRMPGFQYGLEPKEIDAIVAYLKTMH